MRSRTTPGVSDGGYRSKVCIQRKEDALLFDGCGAYVLVVCTRQANFDYRNGIVPQIPYSPRVERRQILIQQ